MKIAPFFISCAAGDDRLLSSILSSAGKYWLDKDGLSPSTEAMLACYASQGFRGLIQKLSGTFAVAIHDFGNQRLHLATDAFGTLPVFVYYQKSHSCFLASTTIKSIVDHLDSPPRLNQTYLFAHPKKNAATQPTLYENIFRLGAGQLLTLDIERWEIDFETHWSLSHAREYPINILGSRSTEKDYVAAYRDLLTKSTRLRLQGVEQAVSTLSGGFDSSILFLLAQQHTSLRALSLCTETSIFNQEIDRALELSQLTATPHDILPCSLFDEPSLIAWQDAVLFAQDPRVNYELLLKSQLFNHPTLQAQAHEVCISGLGSDQYNGGTTAFDYSQEGLHSHWDDFFQQLSSHSYKQQQLNGGNHFFRFAEAFFPSSAQPLQSSLKESWAYYSDNNHQFLAKKTIPLESSISSHHGLLTVYPFLDRTLVAFLQQIPVEMYSSLFFQKNILRKAFLHRLPGSFRAKNKFHPIPHARKFIFRYLQKVIHGNNRWLFRQAFDHSAALNELFDRNTLEKFIINTENSGYFPAYAHLLSIINLGLLDAYYHGHIEMGTSIKSPPEFYSATYLSSHPEVLKKRIDTNKLTLSLEQTVHLSGELDLSINESKEEYYVILDGKLIFKTEEPEAIQLLRLIDGRKSGLELQKLTQLTLEETLLILEFLWSENIVHFSS